jgi:hypothetical protein
VSRAYLVPTGAFQGTVHSVFATACNLAVGGRLITVHDASSAHTPTSIRVAAESAVRWSPLVRAGDGVRCREGFLAVGADVFDLRHLAVWRPRPLATLAAPGVLAPLLDELHRLGEEDGGQHGTVRALAVELYQALTTAPGTLDRLIGRLIGLGPGLTPAGDDVLVGLLAALQQTGTDPGALATLRAGVVQRVHRTTDISAHHLRLAAGGHFSEPISELLDALLGVASRGAVAARVGQVLRVGASSGADALLGVRVGLATHLAHPDQKAA